MDPTAAITAAFVGYLLGAISFARLVAKFAVPDKDISHTALEIPGKDIKIDMTSVSATSVMMHTGPKFGCMTSILDMVKVTAPTLFFDNGRYRSRRAQFSHLLQIQRRAGCLPYFWRPVSHQLAGHPHHRTGQQHFRVGPVSQCDACLHRLYHFAHSLDVVPF